MNGTFEFVEKGGIPILEKNFPRDLLPYRSTINHLSPHNISIDIITLSSYCMQMQQSTVTGKQLMEWRESQGLSRKWLSSKIGCSQSALWKWECSDYVPVMTERACAAVKAGLPVICETPTKGE